MNTLAKILGWGYFGLQTISQIAVTGGIHGVAGWVGVIGSLLVAGATHAASESAPSK